MGDNWLSVASDLVKNTYAAILDNQLIFLCTIKIIYLKSAPQERPGEECIRDLLDLTNVEALMFRH